MDRSVLEGDPHAVLEGLIIGGYAIGAHEGYIYARAEYPIAIKRLEACNCAGKGKRTSGEKIMDRGLILTLKLRRRGCVRLRRGNRAHSLN
jgi:NADH:ubiquinone oxidoreductase subunit F (NADH-binding)